MSLESSDTVSCRRPLERETSTESTADGNADVSVDSWLNALAMTAELETMSILYAKSVLDPNASSQLGAARVAINCSQNVKTPDSSAESQPRIEENENKKLNDLAISKAAARFSKKSGPNGSLSSGASDASSVSDDETVSRFTFSLPNAASMRRLDAAERVSVIQMNTVRTLEQETETPRSSNSELKPGTSIQYPSNSQEIPPAIAPIVVYRPKVEFRVSQRPKLSASALSRRSMGVLTHNLPPTFRHSIRINDDGGFDFNSNLSTTIETTRRTTQIAPDSGSGRFCSVGGCASPISSSRRSSSDGTAGSAGSLVVSTIAPPALPPRRPNMTSMTSSWVTDGQAKQQTDRPGYIRVASCLDQILSAAGVLNSALHGVRSVDAMGALRFSMAGERRIRELNDRALAFIRLVRETICGAYFLHSTEFECVERAAHRLDCAAPPALNSRNHFIVACRQMLEYSMLVFVRIVCEYLNECGSDESLLPITLEHLVQTLLFGDDICLEAVKCGAIDRIMRLIGASSTVQATRRLLLRTLAMLCATSRGCLQLLAIEDGLEMIMQTLCAKSHGADDALSVEAAGVLTQITRPAHASLSELSDACVGSCVRRLLDLIDAQARRHTGGGPANDSHEALLLCSASLANLSLYGSGGEVDGVPFSRGTAASSWSFTAQLLYEHNAPRRLICAVDTIREAYIKQKTANSPLFVQEQVVTVLSRMANRGYSQALIAQGSVAFLLKIFADCAAVPPPASWRRHINATIAAQCPNAEFRRRVCYKAAVCLGMLASSGAGLRALYDSRGYGELCEVLRIEVAAGGTSPLALICASLKQRLEATYKVESAV